MLSPEQLSEIRERLQAPGLLLDLRPEWGAAHDDHRVLIREDLSRRLNGDYRNLEVWPKPTNDSVSISHCNYFGGYAQVAKPQLIGIDIEITKRVRMEIIKRVSNPGEVEAAPYPAALWTAKEAAFKALSQAGVAEIMSDFSIFGWEPLSGRKTTNLRDGYSFQVSNPQTPLIQGQGLVFSHDDVFIALFLKLAK